MAGFGSDPFGTSALGGDPGSVADALGLTDAVTHSAQVAGFGAPSGLAVVPAGSPGQLSLSWNSVSGASGYDIERDGTVIVSSHAGTTYTDTGLVVGTIYSYRVRSVA